MAAIALKWILFYEFIPIEWRFVPVLSPVLDPAVLDSYHGDAMNFSAVLKSEFAGADLLYFVKNQVMPCHFHGPLATFVATEEFEQCVAPTIQLLIGRLAVNSIFGETISRLSGVTFVPSLRQFHHQRLEFCGPDLLRAQL